MPKLVEERLKFEADWNWLAGIFEGEGTAGLRWAKKRHQGSARRAYLFVAISQRETSMLLEVQRITGMGKIYPANRVDSKSLYSWQCATAQARSFLTYLLPFVRSDHKKEQVTNALVLDAEMRIEGTRVRRETLKRNSEERWRKYRAKVSGTEVETRIPEPSSSCLRNSQ